MKTTISKVLALCLTLCCLAACNTMEGMGKDISSAGDALTGTASDVKNQ